MIGIPKNNGVIPAPRAARFGTRGDSYARYDELFVYSFELYCRNLSDLAYKCNFKTDRTGQDLAS